MIFLEVMGWLLSYEGPPCATGAASGPVRRECTVSRSWSSSGRLRPRDVHRALREVQQLQPGGAEERSGDRTASTTADDHQSGARERTDQRGDCALMSQDDRDRHVRIL